MIVCVSPNGSDVTTGNEAISDILVGTTAGVYHLRCLASGEWKIVNVSLERSRIGALLYEPGSERLLAGTYGDGLYASDDIGSSWNRVGQELPSDVVFSLAARQLHNAITLYLGLEPVGLFCSEDLGATWRELPAVREVPGSEQWEFPGPPRLAHLKSFAFHPFEIGSFFVAVEQGALLKTLDGGETWAEISSYAGSHDEFRRDVHRIAMQPSNPDALVLNTGCGTYTSIDGGRHWRQVLAPGGRVSYPDPLFIDPNDERTIFVVGAERAPVHWPEGPAASANPTVMRSRDFGRHWEDVTPAIPDDPILGNFEAASMHRSPSRLSLFVAGTAGKVYSTEDGGDSWDVVIGSLPPVSKSRHYRKFLNDDDRAILGAEILEQAAVVRAKLGLTP